MFIKQTTELIQPITIQQLLLTIQNYASSCIPFKGAQVDIWHANPQGLYSGISQIGTEGKMYLRGYQITDNNGTVKFNTVYPGWYEGKSYSHPCNG